MSFGKHVLEAFRAPNAPPELGSLLEITFPFKQFYHQLAKSLETPGPKGPFIEAVKSEVAKLKYPTNLLGAVAATTRPVPPPRERIGCARCNAAVMSLYDDDAAIDFFYLDAMTLHSLSQGTRLKELKGVIRVVLTPSVFLRYLTAVAEIAASLVEQVPSLSVDQLAAQ